LTDLPQTKTFQHVMLLQKYKDKQFLCGHIILTEDVFVVRESQFDELFGLRQIAVS
jgi:hypothetical protein